MEYLFEFLLELILEGSVEASKNSKVPRYVRYPLIALIVLFFVAVIGLIFLAGFISLKDNKILGLLLILLGAYMLIMSIVKFRKIYLIKKEN